MGVRWGKMVTGPDEAERAAAEGFDFVQPLDDLVVGWGEEELLRQEARIGEGGAAFEVCAVPLPSKVRVTQKGFNLYVWAEHLKHAIRRIAGLGCKKLVWSDGLARVLPVEGEVSGLKEQVLQFLFMLCGLAESFRITVLVEPLGPGRTNFLNTMEEVAELLPRVGKENLCSVISLRELESIGLSGSDLGRYRKLIGHVQMESPRFGRGESVSQRPDDGYDYRALLRALEGMGYSETVSLPGGADAAALERCRRLWEA
jgi:sugar phosphate isomerase/epimerase